MDLWYLITNWIMLKMKDRVSKYTLGIFGMFPNAASEGQ